MRDALRELGGDPAKINPLVPVEMVVDHSVIAEASGTAQRLRRERRHRVPPQHRALPAAALGPAGLRRLPGRAPGHGHLPPGQPRVPVPGGLRHRGRPRLLRHAGGHRLPHHHGQRARRARLGRGRHRGRGGHARPAPVAAPAPGGRLPPDRRGSRPAPPPPTWSSPSPTCCASTAWSASSWSSSDPGVASVPLANRATIGNMSPEYGATCAMFPIDDVTLDYLRFSGRDDHHVDLVEAYAKAQGMFLDPGRPRAGLLRGDRARPVHRGAEHRRPVPAPGPGDRWTRRPPRSARALGREPRRQAAVARRAARRRRSRTATSSWPPSPRAPTPRTPRSWWRPAWWPATPWPAG